MRGYKIKTIKQKLLSVLAVLVLVFIPLTQVRADVSVTITSPANGATTATDFTVTGTAEVGNEITVNINGTDVGTTTADGSGNWSLDVTGQTDGAKTITATATGDTLVHIGGFADTEMNILDASTDTAVAGTPFDVGTVEPFGVVISPDGSTMYLTDLSSLSYGDTISVIDLVSRTVVDTITMSTDPSDGGQMVISPDGTTLYVAIGGTASIDVIDTATNTVTDTITLDDTAANGLAISSDGSVLYASDSLSVDIIDTSTNTTTGSVVLGSTPVRLALSNDDSTLYAGDTSSPGNIYVIDTASETLTDTIIDGNNIGIMVVNPDDSTLYAVSQNDWSGAENSSVLVIDTATNTVTDEVETGRLTFGIDITPDGSKVYAVSFGNPFDSFNGAGTWTIDTSTNIATFLTGSESLNAVFGNDFILQETATASIDVTVSAEAEAEELADTGMAESILIVIAIAVLSIGVLIRYRLSITKN